MQFNPVLGVFHVRQELRAPVVHDFINDDRRGERDLIGCAGGDVAGYFGGQKFTRDFTGERGFNYQHSTGWFNYSAYRMRGAYHEFDDVATGPGNSGGPMVDPADGAVVGVINSTYVQETKESAADRPSGITFAMPIPPAIEMLRKAGLEP